MPNMARVTVGACVVYVSGDVTVLNTKYDCECNSAPCNDLLCPRTAYRVTQADPCRDHPLLLASLELRDRTEGVSELWGAFGRPYP